MEAIKEITQWNIKNINHTYLMDKSFAVAYIPYGSNTPHKFSKPMAIDKHHRKFEKVNIALFKEVL